MATNTSDVIYISKIVGDGGLVVGIEPDKNNVQEINDYIAQNKLKNIIIVEKAVWRMKGTFPLLLGKQSMHNRLEDIGGEYASEEIESYVGKCLVETDTLDNIVADLGITDISHIRLTINGAELDVLEGMEKILAKEYDNGLNLVIAGGKTTPYGPFIDGETTDQRMTAILEKNGFQMKHDNKGWIIAWK